MNLNIGDEVIIRPGLEAECYYNDTGKTMMFCSVGVMFSMVDYAGYRAKITDIDREKSAYYSCTIYRLNIDGGEFMWTAGMLILVKPVEERFNKLLDRR